MRSQGAAPALPSQAPATTHALQLHLCCAAACAAACTAPRAPLLPSAPAPRRKLPLPGATVELEVKKRSLFRKMGTKTVTARRLRKDTQEECSR